MGLDVGGTGLGHFGRVCGDQTSENLAPKLRANSVLRPQHQQEYGISGELRAEKLEGFAAKQGRPCAILFEPAPVRSDAHACEAGGQRG